MGRLLLGKDGGEIIASTNDISLIEVEDIYDQIGQLFGNGGVKEWDTPLVDALWVNHKIPRGSNKTKVPPVVSTPTTTTPTTTTPPSPGRTFTGTWKSSYGTLTLTQSGAAVSGSSDYYSTQVQGTIGADGKLTFTWSDSNKKRGTGTFVLASDGKSFSGSWDYTLSTGQPANRGGGWSGTRIE